MKLLTISIVACAALALSACDRPRAPQLPYSSEDACEDAGMSDAFCDAMFPEYDEQRQYYGGGGVTNNYYGQKKPSKAKRAYKAYKSYKARRK